MSLVDTSRLGRKTGIKAEKGLEEWNTRYLDVFWVCRACVSLFAGRWAAAEELTRICNGESRRKQMSTQLCFWQAERGASGMSVELRMCAVVWRYDRTGARMIEEGCWGATCGVGG